MKNKVVQAFFNGAFDLLDASFTASRELSNAAKGTSREDAARALLRSFLPAVARIESGDVIDTYGAHTGQLDAVMVDHRAPSLRLGASETGLILAEGAVAVIEIKSSLPKQWSQVLKTYARVAPIRPRVALMSAQPSSVAPSNDLDGRIRKRHNAIAELHNTAALKDQTIPFVVVAGKGFAKAGELERRARLLEQSATTAADGRIAILTMDPPAYVATTNSKATHRRDRKMFDALAGEFERGDALAALWHMLVGQARLHSGRTYRRLLLEQYFAGVQLAETSPP